LNFLHYLLQQYKVCSLRPLVNATDNAGNLNSSVTLTITVDDVAPSLASPAPADSGYVTAPLTAVPFNISVTELNIDYAANASVSYRRQGISTYTVATLACPGTSPFSCTTTADVSGIVGEGDVLEFYFNSTDTAGNLGVNGTPASPLTATVDTTSPNVTNFATDDTNGNVTSNQTINFSVTVIDGQSVSTVTMNGTSLTSAASNVYWTTNTTSQFANCPTDGDCTLYIVATDSAGNSNSSETLTLTVDDTLPVVNAFTVNSTINVTSTENINFTANVTNGGSGVSTVTMNGTTLIQGSGDLWHTANTTTQFSCTGNVNCTFSINATDGAGLSNISETITLRVDDFAAAVTSFSTDDANGNVTNTTSVNFTVTVIDNGMSGVSTVTMNGTTMESAGSNVFWLVNSTENFSNCGSNSDCTFNIVATDIAGNQNDSVSLTITVDGIAPSVASIITNDTDGNVSRTQFINFTVNATDANGISTVSMNSTTFTQGSGDLWHAVNITSNFTRCPSDGDCTLTVTATDGAGNVNSSETLVITTDNTIPAIPSFTVNSTLNATSSENINFTVNVTDTSGSGVSTVTMNGTSLSAGSGNLWHAVNTTNEFGCSGNVNCTFAITATDIAGNQNTSESITIQVDNFGYL